MPRASSSVYPVMRVKAALTHVICRLRSLIDTALSVCWMMAASWLASAVIATASPSALRRLRFSEATSAASSTLDRMPAANTTQGVWLCEAASNAGVLRSSRCMGRPGSGKAS